MDMKRRIARGVSVLAVALLAGHLVQSMAGDRRLEARAGAAAKDVVLLSAGADTLPPQPPVLAEATLRRAPEPVAEAALPKVPSPEGMAVLAAIPQLKAAAPDPAAGAIAEACPTHLDLSARASAMISVMLTAPCQAGARVVLRHGGLAITLQTSATGLLLAEIPGMETSGTVEAAFGDGTVLTSALAMPEVGAMRRFAVQWQADDAFQIQAYENGAGFGAPGHISASAPHTPAAGAPAKGGFLTLLGDPTVAGPLMAQVYSFPADPAARIEVVVEAAVTPLTCGRELIGETVLSNGGKPVATDLNLAMPGCDAVGDYVMLQNLVPDLKLAFAN